MKLNRDFFNRDAVTLAKELLGKVLTHETEDGVIKGIISETEAYLEEDEASHSYRGKITKRNKVMFEEGGFLYVYFTYGMYHCCNIIANKKGIGEAVLIRAVKPLEDIDIMIRNRNWKNKSMKNLVNGPGKVCQAYLFNLSHNGVNLTKSESKIYLEDIGFKPTKIINTERIGISKAKDLKYRFVAEDFTKN